jgi:hypothetical protein
MARRESAIGEAQVRTDGTPVDGPVCDPTVLAHFRLYWPPQATQAEIDKAVHEALTNLYANLRNRQEGRW